MQEELSKRGYIYKGTHSGWYSITDECFYTDAQVSSRKSTNSESEEKYAVETGSVVEWAEEENYKFRLGALKEQLVEHFEKYPDCTFFSSYVKTETDKL